MSALKYIEKIKEYYGDRQGFFLMPSPEFIFMLRAFESMRNTAVNNVNRFYIKTPVTWEEKEKMIDEEFEKRMNEVEKK